MKWKELKSIKHVGIWEIILNPHIALLALSSTGLEFQLWSLLTLSVIGVQTLNCFSKVLMACALLSILSRGCPCSNVKCLWEPWLGLIGAFSSNAEWLILDPEKVGSTSLISKLFQSMRHVWTFRVRNQASTGYLGSFWKHAREFGLLTVTGATTEIWKKTRLNSHAMCWACITKNWFPNPPLGDTGGSSTLPVTLYTHTSFYLYI